MISKLSRFAFVAIFIFGISPSFALQQPVSAPGLAPGNNLSDLQNSFAASNNLAQVSQRAPARNDDSSKGYSAGDIWCAAVQCWQANSVAVNNASWSTMPIGNVLPLDVPGISAAGAYGTVLMTRNANVVALNKSIDIWRSLDQTTKTIGWANGYVDAQAADAFCQPSWAVLGTCEISKAYDQSFNVSSGALNSFDATITPGWIATSASLASGGTCTAGTYTFTVAGGTGTAATISGTVSGTALSGSLTVVTSGSYATQPANSVATTGGTCTVQPTLNLVFTQQAPQWSTNTVNGLRSLNFSTNYAAGNPQNYTAVSQSLLIPSGSSVNLQATTALAAIQSRSAIYGINTLATLGAAAGGNVLAMSLYAPGVEVEGTQTTSLVARTSPAIWSYQTGSASTSVRINNLSGSAAASQPNVSVNGSVIGGYYAARWADFDLLGLVLYNATLSATTLANAKASLALLTKTTLHAQRNLVVAVGDSITYGFLSPYGNSWVKFMQMRGLLPSAAIINLGYPGAQFVGGSRDFTANKVTDWQGIYNASIPNIVVPIALGTNDIGNSTSAATTFSRNQAYASYVQGLGTNIKTVAVTLLPRSDGGCNASCLTNLASYNALVRTNWALPIAQGGLGAAALCDWANDPIFSSGSFSSYLVAGLHPTDPGAEDMAITCSAAIEPLLH